DWVIAMASRITEHPLFPGTSSTCYELYFVPSGNSYSLTWKRIAGVEPNASDSGEILIKLDWSQLAHGDDYDTYDVAAYVGKFLLLTNFISELGGHALSELPIHLVRHSSGGSLVRI